MIICAIQARPFKGDIQANINRHKELVDLATRYKADLAIFPELSLSGYEPTLAKALAIPHEDERLEDFQHISDKHRVVLGMGAPTVTDKGLCISMIFFQPDLRRKIYSKKYLHTDEEEFFTSGPNFVYLDIGKTRVAPAICYELAVKEHTETAFENGASIYAASVAKFKNGIDSALERLEHIAQQYSMTVLMANCVGKADGQECAGKTSVWDRKGKLIAQLDGTREGLLIYNTQTGETKLIYP